MAETPFRRDVMMQTLIYHQRGSVPRCCCGWSVPGKSYAEHVIEVYEMAMLYEAD